jgi:hypothetical protein
MEEHTPTDTGSGKDPDWGEGADPPEAGQGAGETSPAGGVEPGMPEHPEDVEQPEDQQGDASDTEAPASPPDPDDG